MKWVTEKPIPRDGDKRRAEYFAWKPTKLDDGHTVWLEWWGREETYRDESGCSDCSPKWIPGPSYSFCEVEL